MGHKLPNDLILDYQIEYQTTDITIAKLCEKYGVQTKQLPGYTKWEKQAKEQTAIVELVDIIDIAPPPVARPEHRDIVLATDKTEILSQVSEFKALAMAHALKFMNDDSEFSEVKEFKDVVAIVDSIEKSYKDIKLDGTTINIAIQNIVKDFKDDC